MEISEIFCDTIGCVTRVNLSLNLIVVFIFFSRDLLHVDNDRHVIAENFTYISYVVERAVSFGASASFGDARFSLWPPGLRSLDAVDRIPNM